MPYKISGAGAMRNFGGYANLHVYCYTVEADTTEPPFFPNSMRPFAELFGVDFPAGTKIIDPTQYPGEVSRHPKASFLTYKIATDNMGKMVAWYPVLPPATPQEITPTKLTFCVILDGGGGEIEDDVSFDTSVVMAGGAPSLFAPARDSTNTPVPSVKLRVPIAMSPGAAPADPATFLASYEGVKLAYTLSLASFPLRGALSLQAARPLTVTPAIAGPVQPSAPVPSRPMPEPGGRRKPRRQARRVRQSR